MKALISQHLLLMGQTVTESQLSQEARLASAAAGCHWRSCRRPARASGAYQRRVRIVCCGRYRQKRDLLEELGVSKDLSDGIQFIFYILFLLWLNSVTSETSRICARGYPVCRLAWLRYLGVGKQRLERCKRVFHGIDDRTINQGFVAAVELENKRRS